MLIKEFPFFTNDECDEIKQYCYEKEKELKDRDPTERYNNSITTNSYNQYNFFRDHPIYAERLVSFLNATEAPLEWPIMVQSWVNIYRKGDGIGWHKHRGDALSFNIFIDGDTEPGPAYILAGKVYEGLGEYDMKVQNYPNKRGYIQIFPSSTYHKVDPVNYERVSLGGTIHHNTSIHSRFDYIDNTNTHSNLDLLALNNRRENGIIILSKND